jgi:hypothetical protein
MTPELELALRQQLNHCETVGLRLAAVRRAYRVARQEWSALPQPVFEEAVELWAVANADGWAEEGGEAATDVSLAEFVEDYVLGELHDHLDIVWRGSKFTVKGVTGCGRRALTLLYQQGAQLASDFRAALLQLWHAMPVPTEDEEREVLRLRFGVEGE